MKSKGDLLRAVFKTECQLVDDWRHWDMSVLDRVAAEYEKASFAELPADVMAFVDKVDALASKATRGPWSIRRDEADPDDPPDTIYAVRAFGPWVYVEHTDADLLATKGDVDGDEAAFIVAARSDVPTLCRIVRERIALIDQALNVADEAATLVDQCAAENEVLRERFDKLETAACLVLEGLNSPTVAPSRGCSDHSCNGNVCGPKREFWARVEALRVLLSKSKGDSTP